MATLASKEMVWFSLEWEKGIDSAFRREDAATQAGIVGDLAHRLSGGYHISREDQPGSNYSIAQFGDDRLGRADLASAVDMTMDPTAMVTVTRRLVDAWHREDPRLSNVRGFNGTLDGRSGIRKDASNPDPRATDYSDSTHTWHVHLEFFRRYADDLKTMQDVLSVILGSTILESEELATASDKINAWMVGSERTTDGELVAPTVWRVRDEAWQAAVNKRLDAIEAKAGGQGVSAPSAAEIAAEIIKQLRA